MIMWIPLAAVIAADNAFQKAPETPTPPDSSPSEGSGATLPLPDPEKVTTEDCNCKKGVSHDDGGAGHDEGGVVWNAIHGIEEEE